MFRVGMPLRTFLEAPTVAEMAVRIVQYQVEALVPTELTCWLAEAERLPDA
jgi:hypothetical protein